MPSALGETGLRVVVAEGGEGALDVVRAEKPLVLVIALGIFGIEPLELLQAARVDMPGLPIFLIGDRDGALPDEDTAARAWARRASAPHRRRRARRRHREACRRGRGGRGRGRGDG